MSNIEPQQAYYLSIEAVDTDTGRSVKSTPTFVEFSQGEFDLVDLNGVLRVLQVEPSVFNTFSLTLQVSEELFYPNVNLIVDNSQLPSGILAQFVQEEDGFTLIQSGQTVQLDIYVDGVITEGTYPLPIIAYNGQTVKRLDYFVVVGEPNCDPKADLTGDFVPYTQYKIGTITNSNINPLCSYDVGMASYEKFNNKISDQRIF
ncbi:MAG: hypothetical protein KDE51_19040, partial [Anaerolineales bacterium]|nr:hypothetical protein [Anaerolineales bacterium]